VRLLLPLAAALALLAAGPAAAAKTPIPGIRTPSGNIGCLFVPGAAGAPAVLRCDLHSSNYAGRLQAQCAARAGLDWHGFELPALKKGAVTCSGGILYSPAAQRPVYRTLAYGRTWRHGAFTCVSARTGLTCRNRSGHGLFLARESWRAW
jgi:Family of unknown function (DUF6636)